ncbi:MmcQ/YjbR family DNA-binding protein [Streptomyces sp. WM6378]|uniref:MmcQ/YjbR family DNA-binding protein n=1 Tax=Streptomyces sp. WM6378 TaxID=1415557 RepID=UPI0007C83D29|nr:MmcQ/YjbR family DNA-binding protein [Streptomyces sp. WM6378]
MPEATEHEPGPGMCLYKVGGKIFAVLTPATGARPDQVTLKCEPGLAPHLRAQHAAVRPGLYGHRQHWNTVVLDGTVSDGELADMIDHSWERVVARLSRATREQLLRLRAGLP